jgi:hypothetical protein
MAVVANQAVACDKSMLTACRLCVDVPAQINRESGQVPENGFCGSGAGVRRVKLRLCCPSDQVQVVTFSASLRNPHHSEPFSLSCIFR